MKNTSITSAIIISIMFSVTIVFATGNECKKASKKCNKANEEALKFSVNDFVGKEDSQREETDFLDYPVQKISEKASDDQELSEKKSEN